ncbi:thioredoxin family protein [Pseudonocardia pini]|uniref:thioredoxin family protein n=1 Tax=Pseudonocardia pini TaxID=2758030 RepID=UPI0015F0549B|nr:thioredoxin family protein [Pseudonocardia pini]
MSGTGLVVVLAVLAVATAVGFVLRSRSGRVREVTEPTSPNGWVLADARPTADERVLLLQLSSPICTPCRQTAAMLDALAAAEPDVRHVEIDVADRPEVAVALSVLRTPTTVGFDRTGREVLRISGVPRHAELTEALHGVPRA